MSITYADQPLLIEDPEGRFQHFISQNQPLFETRFSTPRSAAQNSHLAGGRRPQPGARGLPIPNYPPPPPVRLNVLHWPTGAGRYSTFFGIADDETKEAIVTRTVSGGRSTFGFPMNPAALQLSDGNQTIETQMWLLPPRPITAVGADGIGAWLIPLVDQRYFWQQMEIGEYDWNEDRQLDFSWEAIVRMIGNKISREIDETGLGADYFDPDQAEMHRPFESVAVMLDAVAHSLGRRVVTRLDGSVWLRHWFDSNNDLNENLTAGDVICGGPTTNDCIFFPEQVCVAFRYYRDGMILDCDDDAASVQNITRTVYQLCPTTINSFLVDKQAFRFVPGWKKVIHTTYLAKIGYNASVLGSTDLGVRETPPQNNSQLQRLANVIATDTINALAKHYDWTFQGLKNWRPTGWDNCIEWFIGHQYPDGTYRAQTRVQTFNYDFGCEVQCSQDKNLIILPDEVFGLTNGTITGFNSGTKILGHGLLNVYVRKPDWKVGSSVGVADIEDVGGASLQIFNLAEQSVAGTSWAQAKKVGCIWMLDFVECDPTV